jgi:BlaI family transcriptional regulator, penicillinase repressor
MSKTYQPSTAELEILKVIWELEPVGVREVHERITLLKQVGYTTVLKQMQRLLEKGVLEKEVQDNTHRYRTTVREQEVKKTLVEQVVQTAFGGSAVQMMMQALGQQKPSREELEELQAWLDTQMKNHP